MDGFLIGFGRWGWSLFWTLLAVASAAYVFHKGEPWGVAIPVLLCTTVVFLGLALSGRFLFTGEWRSPRQELHGDGVLSPGREIGPHEGRSHVLPRTTLPPGERGIRPQDRV
jgi:hypothetical protein